MEKVADSEFGSKLRELRESKNISLRQLERQSGVSYSFISQVERGLRSIPKPATLEKIAKGLRVPKETLFSIAGLPFVTDKPNNLLPFKSGDVVQVPIVDNIKCGPDGLAMNDFQGYEFVSKDDINEDDDYFWLITTGDSMIGDYIQDGDYALIKRGNAFENGDICAVIVDGEEGTLKHVTKNKDSIVLSASNPSYPPRVFVGDDMNDIYIAGTLVEIKHKFK